MPGNTSSIMAGAAFVKLSNIELFADFLKPGKQPSGLFPRLANGKYAEKNNCQNPTPAENICSQNCGDDNTYQDIWHNLSFLSSIPEIYHGFHFFQMAIKNFFDFVINENVNLKGC